MNVKLLKTQSLLLEVLQEALYSLEDTRLSTLNVIKVECSRGKEFAKVFLDPTPLNADEQKATLKLLKKADNIIHQYLRTSLNWYKTPKLVYEFDDSLEHINRLEDIFKQISKEGEK